MDLVDFDQARVRGHRRRLLEPSPSRLGFERRHLHPVSRRSRATTSRIRRTHLPWYHGPTLLGHLETRRCRQRSASRPFRLPVQWVNRPHLDFRGLPARRERGDDARRGSGDPSPSGKRAHVARIVTADGDLDRGARGQRRTLTLRRGGRCQPGRFDRAARCDRPSVADQFAARSSGSTRSRCCPGGPTFEVRLPDRDRDGLQPQIQAQCRQSRPCRRARRSN